MNYKKLYKSLILKAKNDPSRDKKNGYYEKHHVIPDFMFKDRKRKGPAGHLAGNPNSKNNIVLLTAREHFYAHLFFEI